MLRCRVVFSGFQGAPYLGTFYSGTGTGITQLDAQNWANAVGTFWTTVDAQLLTGLSWATEPDIADVNPVTGQVLAIQSTTAQTGSGNIVSTSLPFASQALLRLLTGVYVGGRQVRGRVFVPGVPSGANSNGLVSSALQTAMNNAGTALVADANSNWVVWSRKLGAAHPVSTASAWNQFATLRSRRD